MASQTLLDLLEGNREHVESLAADHFDAVQDEQRPEVVSICCSDSRVSQEGMWTVAEPGRLFTPSNIGNQVWDEYDGERVVNGNLLYPLAHTGTETVAVVGHTGCGAVTAAYRAVTADESGDYPGIEKWVRSLVPVVEAGLDDEAVDADADADAVVNQLVEYNVHRQVAFLREADALPASASVYGFVYDFQRVYGDVPGRTYLVNDDGETDPDAIADRLPEEYADSVASLLY
ncbi:MULTISPECIES: carbonic anhydrase [Halorussus]|uniref:carbonic anhydrase n=1 Tax=Halorussus TaxID=1070314 RepID=UPI000E210D64|nr:MULTISPECIES: carbonic anhydrase [Halorussus]NHN61171.1 carbonic anhydrase [Halorussus sp. JP-T4]